MDSDTFINKNIWEFLSSTEGWKYNYSWYSFIISKDLGIVCLDLFADLYSITDEKKWFINKIKYGF